LHPQLAAVRGLGRASHIAVHFSGIQRARRQELYSQRRPFFTALQYNRHSIVKITPIVARGPVFVLQFSYMSETYLQRCAI
jgi:hypothetical protein